MDEVFCIGDVLHRHRLMMIVWGLNGSHTWLWWLMARDQRHAILVPGLNLWHQTSRFPDPAPSLSQNLWPLLRSSFLCWDGTTFFIPWRVDVDRHSHPAQHLWHHPVPGPKFMDLLNSKDLVWEVDFSWVFSRSKWLFLCHGHPGRRMATVSLKTWGAAQGGISKRELCISLHLDPQ